MSEEVREDYLESLEELTVNSRPIIKTLTEIAQENVAEAEAVASAIETHTLRSPPSSKLPALYLIDSICKNIGEPYASLFTPRIVGIYTNAFDLVPEPIRLKLNKLFKTWTLPNPATNEPLFPHEILRQINGFLQGQQLSQGPSPQHGVPGPVGAPPQGRPRLNQSALMVEMNRFRQVLENDGNDPFTERQLSLLVRLESQIAGVVDPKILPEIQNSLDEMKLAREQHLSRPQSHNNRRNNNGNNRRENRRPRDQHESGANAHGKDRNRNNNGGVTKITGTNSVPIGTKKSRSPKISPTELAAIAQNARNNCPVGTQSAVGNNSTPLEQEIAALDLASACEKPASQGLINQLYSDGLPLQCSTCGYRFHDSEEGRAAKEAEMDWHFRAHKDIREGHSRNRSWFLVALSWISYKDEDEVFGLGSALSTGSGIMNGAGQGNNGSATNPDNGFPVDLEKEREKYVEVPMDSNVACPVCQEPHDPSWSEEAENWVWMNCVEVGGHFFHATCYADPQNKQLVESLLEEK